MFKKIITFLVFILIFVFSSCKSGPSPTTKEYYQSNNMTEFTIGNIVITLTPGALQTWGSNEFVNSILKALPVNDLIELFFLKNLGINITNKDDVLKKIEDVKEMKFSKSKGLEEYSDYIGEGVFELNFDNAGNQTIDILFEITISGDDWLIAFFERICNVNEKGKKKRLAEFVEYKTYSRDLYKNDIFNFIKVIGKGENPSYWWENKF